MRRRDAAAYGRDIFAHEALALQCAGQLAEGAPAALAAEAEAEATRLRGKVSTMEEEADARAKSCLWWTLAAGILGVAAGEALSYRFPSSSLVFNAFSLPFH